MTNLRNLNLYHHRRVLRQQGVIGIWCLSDETLLRDFMEAFTCITELGCLVAGSLHGMAAPM